MPQAVEPVFQHVLTTYASEANKTVSVWRAVLAATDEQGQNVTEKWCDMRVANLSIMNR